MELKEMKRYTVEIVLPNGEQFRSAIWGTDPDAALASLCPRDPNIKIVSLTEDR